MQILVGTLGTLTIPKDNGWYGLAAFIGNPFFALLMAVGTAPSSCWPSAATGH